MKRIMIIVMIGVLVIGDCYSQEACGGIFREEHSTWTFAGRELIAQVSVPCGTGPFPVVMAIHGGGFTGGSRKLYDSSMHQHFIDLDYAFISVEYRLVRDGGQHPEAIRDCLHNLHWIKDHALDFYIDPERIAVIGSSAGAYLAMMVGLTCNDLKYQPDYVPYQQKTTSVSAVISSAAMYDWNSITRGEAYTGEYRKDMKTSPVFLAPGSTTNAFLLLGGEKDVDWSPPDPARTMQRRLRDSGADCELYLRKSTNHPSLYKMDQPYVKWAFEKIDPFLEKYLR